MVEVNNSEHGSQWISETNLRTAIDMEMVHASFYHSLSVLTPVDLMLAKVVSSVNVTSR